MPPLLVDALCLVALLSLLAVAFVHPRGWVEAVSGAAAVGIVAAAGALSWSSVTRELDQLLPVVAFLMASLVVAEVCAADGVFGYLGRAVTMVGGGQPGRTLAVTVLVAALVTALLSLDATVVLLTPVVVAAAAGLALRRPLAATCVRLANSASLLLPVSNLTNLLAFPATGLGFVAWAAVMALPWVVVLAVEYAGVRLVYADDLRESGHDGPKADTSADPEVQTPTTSLVVVGAMLVGFAITSPLGVQPAWVAAAAALVLSVRALATGQASGQQLARALHVPFAAFVLALGLVVAAASQSFLGQAVADLLDWSLAGRVPGPGLEGLLGLLAVTAVGTLLANLLNNLPATLLLLPLVAPLGTPAVLAMLVGLGVGAGLTLPGSLANLLWRRTLVRMGDPPSTATFHRHALLVTPVAVLAAALVLWAECAAGFVS